MARRSQCRRRRRGGRSRWFRPRRLPTAGGNRPFLADHVRRREVRRRRWTRRRDLQRIPGADRGRFVAWRAPEEPWVEVPVHDRAGPCRDDGIGADVRGASSASFSGSPSITSRAITPARPTRSPNFRATIGSCCAMSTTQMARLTTSPESATRPQRCRPDAAPRARQRPLVGLGRRVDPAPIGARVRRSEPQADRLIPAFFSTADDTPASRQVA